MRTLFLHTCACTSLTTLKSSLSAHFDMANHQTDWFSLTTKCDLKQNNIINHPNAGIKSLHVFKSHNQPKINYLSMPSIFLDEFQHAHLCAGRNRSLSPWLFFSVPLKKSPHADANSLRKFENKTHHELRNRISQSGERHFNAVQCILFLLLQEIAKW